MITITFHMKRIAMFLDTVAFRIARLADRLNAKADDDG
jgi:hypothetical protein